MKSCVDQQALSTASGAWERLSDCVSIGKPRVVAMVMVVTLVGFFVGLSEPMSFSLLMRLLWTLVGTGLAGFGANTLNQVVEREHDAQMTRTADRPIAAGRIGARRAGLLGFVAALAGVSLLGLLVNLLTAVVTLTTLATYLLLYTPLKRVSSLSLIVGAVPGALPPVIGWTAAAGRLDPQAGLLFAILFVWQLPHFLSIGWMYRLQYATAGYRVLSVADPDGGRTFRQLIVFSLLLIPISLLPTYFGVAGMVYYMGAMLLGFAFLAFGLEVVRLKTRISARQHVLASLAYLPLLLLLLTLDKVGS